MVISSAFESDIQSKNTQLQPLVVIEYGDLADHIFLSTNNITVDGDYYKPILLNIPSIKESVDVESRKFKISNVSLSISNFPLEDKRFSDILSESSLINTTVSIFIKSPSTTTVTLSAFDINTTNGCPRIYTGIIRRITHDDSKVKIELEDLTEKLAHKDLPQPYPEEKYLLKTIPIVYGDIDKSPAIFIEPPNMEVVADYNNTVTIYPTDPLMIFESDTYLDIPINAISPYSGGIMFRDESEITDSLQYSVDGNIIELNGMENEESGTAIGFNHIISRQMAMTPTTITALRVESGGSEGLHQIKYYGIKHDANSVTGNATDGYVVGDEVEHSNLPIYIRGIVFREGAILADDWQQQSDPITEDALWETETEIFISNLHLQKGWCGALIKFPIIEGIGKYSQGYIHGDISAGVWGLSFWSGSQVTHQFRYGGNISGDSNVDPTWAATAGGTFNLDDNYSPSDNGFNGLSNDGQTWNSITGDDDVAYSEKASEVLLTIKQVDGTGYANAQMKINDLYVEHWDLIDNITNKKYYVNVKGRLNTYDDHPEEGFFGDSDLTDETIVGDFIENPIDIIYDLVRSEIGHEAIDEVEYAEAKLAHDGWKFGFTVNKKINSKQLIEEIAKSTKCFPKFKNDGTFGFNTIKDSYTVDGDYANATLIKESEVISYSFKKTKPEQIVTEVGIKYKKDYAQDSYLKDVFSYISNFGYTKFDTFGDGSRWAYYGIDTPEDAFLEFESDYIRDDHTAHKLREFLFEHNQNNHLIFNLKLPLQYINLEIGDLVKFRDLFNGVKAYGIDYRRIEAPNGQYYYPLFMVTATTKNLDSVSIECMQLHHLSEGINAIPEEGWFDGLAIDTDGEVTDPDIDGLFYFPDSDPIVISDVDVTPFVVTAPVITGLDGMPIVIDYTTTQGSVTVMMPIALAIDGDYDSTNISDFVTITVLGETYPNTFDALFNNGNGIGTFGEDYTGANQILAIYSVTSPTSGYSVNMPVSININVGELAPTVSISPSPLAGDSISFPSGEMTHIVPFEEGVDYFDKYVYNTDTAHISYSATDPNEGSLTNDIEFGTLTGVASGTPSIEIVDVMGQAQSSFGTTFGGIYTMYFSALVFDSSGLYDWAYWRIFVTNEEPEVPLLLGDVNLDGVTNILDVVQIVEYIRGNQELSEEQIFQGDVNSSGGVNILDVVQIVNGILP